MSSFRLILPVQKGQVFWRLALIEDTKAEGVGIYSLFGWFISNGGRNEELHEIFSLLEPGMDILRQGEAVIQRLCQLTGASNRDFKRPVWPASFEVADPEAIALDEITYVWWWHRSLYPDSWQMNLLDTAAYVLRAVKLSDLPFRDVVIRTRALEMLFDLASLEMIVTHFEVRGGHEWIDLAEFLAIVGDVVLSKDSWTKKHPYICIRRSDLWGQLERNLRD